MTGHDLDLAQEIREVAETWLYDGDADRPLPGFDRLYDLADEVESRCAKLAAAETYATATLRLLAAERTRVAAVWEACGRLADGWLGACRLSGGDAALLRDASTDVRAALAAAEQDEPKREQS